MIIKGFQKSSLIDYPPYAASVIFLGGCSFRCGFCHNPLLVNSPLVLPTIKENEIFDYLKEKKQWLDAVVITGGEPTLYDDLPIFVSKLKEIGFLVKLDTNGSNPLLLKELVSKVDFIAMDIKSSLERYAAACNAEVSTDIIKESAEIVRSCKDYEFRTTVCPAIIDAEDIEKIGKWLSGSKKYVIQQFRNSSQMIDSKFRNLIPYSNTELQYMASIAKKYFNAVEVRN